MVVKTSKEDLAMYLQLPKLYLKKKYKHGIKLADKILTKKCSSVIVTKTLAWKALFWGLLGNADAGMKNIQTALRKDSQSSLCWHVYGKLHTIKGELEKAVECYKSALTIAPDSVGVAKDLAFAQAHMGDMGEFKNACETVLRGLPKSRQSWMSFAVASHVSGDLEGALNVLHSLQNREQTQNMKLNAWELSEMLLYYNQLLQETGNVRSALMHLIDNRHRIKDTASADEHLMRLYIESGQHQEAQSVIRSLLKNNPNNIEYYRSLFTALNADTDAHKLDILEDLLAEYPEALTPQLLILQYTTGKKFIQFSTNFMKIQLCNGSINLFSSIKCMIKNAAKRDFALSFLDNAFLNKNLTVNKSKQAEIEAFSNRLCTARLLDYGGDYVAALESAKKAISVNPLGPDGYVTKARILKHLMNPVEACRAMEKAQRLEPGDRWLEMKLVKYLLRADLVEAADKLYLDFHRHEEERVENIWYLYEQASAYHRMGQDEAAFKLCQTIDDVVTEIEKNNYEMHSICMAKSSLRAYVQFLDANRNLRKNSYYLKTAALAVKIAMQLQDAKLVDFKKQRRKVKKKQIFKKAPSRMKNSTTPKKNEVQSKETSQSRDSSESDIPPPKSDPNFFQNYLLDARDFLRVLQTYASDEIDTQILSYGMYSRLRRPLLMMQSLLKARRINKDHHSLLVPTVDLHQSLVRWGAKDKLPQKKLTVLLEMGRIGLWRNKSMEELINTFLRKHGKDLLYLLEGAKALYLLHPYKRDDAIRLACHTGKGTKNLNVQTCRRVLDELNKGSFGRCDIEADLYRKKCCELFKLSTAFDISAVKKIRQQDLMITIDNREPIASTA